MERRARILVVDDEPANRRLLSDLAVREGYEAVTAEGGEEALALLADGSIDLVLLDLMMPRVDGMAVLAELQRRGLLPALPVVVVSALDERKVRLDALTAGAVDFIEKPFDLREIGCRLHTLVELSRLREAARADAAAARAQLQAVVESAPDTVISVDREGKVLFVNHVLPGYTREQVVGAAWASYLQPEGPAPARPVLEEVFSTGRKTVFEARAKGADGAPLSFEAHASPVRVAGELVGAVIVARDITEKKRTELQLMVSDRMASVGTLAAGVAHEINNPLAAVIANLELLEQDTETLASRHADDEVVDMRAALRDAADAAERIRLIVRDLKLFSRTEEAERVSPTDVVHVLESTVRMAWNEIRHRAKLVKDFATVPLVAANESRLGQVFLNLIVNAAQAIPEGNAEHNEIRIVTLKEPSGRVQIDIRDTGPGIPPDVLRRLFTPFFTTKPVGVGTGLGLSICQRLVTTMGGEIRIESEVGRGTTVRVLLPPATSALVAPKAAPPVPPLRSFRRGKILVIDDEPTICQAIERTLKKEHDVTVTHHAEEALELLASPAGRFDVIFCDLMMPQMTGMELFDRLIASELTEPAARMVFLTGGAFTEGARQFLEGVTNPRMEKPFDVAKLRAFVSSRVR